MASELIRRVRGGSEDEPTPLPFWWSGYYQGLKSRLSESSVKVVDLDSEYILQQGIYGDGNPSASESAWPASRVRRGLVMGSVQSGKTASMLAVTAKSLDAGVDIVIILAGTRLSLWRQTYDRMLEQLDCWSPANADSREIHRSVLPRPEFMRKGRDVVSLDHLYKIPCAQFKRHVSTSKPIVAVVMKHPDHLTRIAKVIQEGIRSSESLRKPIQLLIIDDEADDGSVLDAYAESTLANNSDAYKQIPRHIARIWAGRGSPTTSFSEHLFATYLAYTATPQANFLQSDHNPLSPRDFLVALRTPGGAPPCSPRNIGPLQPPRKSFYEELRGLSKHYTGGDYFYSDNHGQPGSLIQSYVPPISRDFDTYDEFEDACQEQTDKMLGDALRSFFVSGALRLLTSQKRLSDVWESTFEIKSEIDSLSPDPHTMLVHPSALVDQHERTARMIACWSCGFDQLADAIGSETTDSTSWPVLSSKGLEERLQRENDVWKSTFQHFLKSWEKLLLLPGSVEPEGLTEITWQQVQEVLTDEIFKYARLSVINSHDQADDRPEFSPSESDGKWAASADLLTIFVSGNVMSRGLTLEGLSTCVFTRTVERPSADTQMQMQRWFGYRGSYLGFCRIFLFEDQLSRFRSYHNNDIALRGEIIESMNEDSSKAPSPLVLQGSGFRATAKISNLRGLPLCPGPSPFVRVLGTGEAASANCDLLSAQIELGSWEPLVVNSIERGLIRTDPISLTEAACLLETFRYENYIPDPDALQNARWNSIANQLQIDANQRPLFRPPPRDMRAVQEVPPSQCPYSIAAYLRLWKVLLNRKAPHFYSTDDPNLPWSSIEPARHQANAPSFYVGVRSGDAGDPVDKRLRARNLRCMTRARDDDGRLVATWGSRNPGAGPDAYLGDELFDYHRTGLQPPRTQSGEPPWRPTGHPGLILFHVIKGENCDLVTVGVSVPLGGPDHFAAIRGTD